MTIVLDSSFFGKSAGFNPVLDDLLSGKTFTPHETDFQSLNELERSLNCVYRQAVSSIDLSCVVDPADPSCSCGYRLHGTYRRSLFLSVSGDISISLTVFRIRRIDGTGSTHALLPWFLTPYSRYLPGQCLALIRNALQLKSSGKMTFYSFSMRNGLFPALFQSFLTRYQASLKLLSRVSSDPLSASTKLEKLVYLSVSCLRKSFLQACGKVPVYLLE
jgi:hypothetical protein